MDDRGKKNDEESYEKILKDRKLKYEQLRKKSYRSNKFVAYLINAINSVVNFIRAFLKIIYIFFRTLFGYSDTITGNNGSHGNDDDNFPKKKYGDMSKSRIMELKNLGSCLGSS